MVLCFVEHCSAAAAHSKRRRVLAFAAINTVARPVFLETLLQYYLVARCKLYVRLASLMSQAGKPDVHVDCEEFMLNLELKNHLMSHVWSRVNTPAQYMGSELNIVRKDHDQVRGKLCMAFPDAYTIGMSHHGLQVLYTLMNNRDDWACERVFTRWPDMEAELRKAEIPLYSLETYTPLSQFDVIGFSLQYEVSYPNLLTMLDLGGIPLRGTNRTMADPLVIAGGPCAQNPEPIAPFIDVL
jgi:hypothetical protein